MKLTFMCYFLFPLNLYMLYREQVMYVNKISIICQFRYSSIEYSQSWISALAW